MAHRQFPFARKIGKLHHLVAGLEPELHRKQPTLARRVQRQTMVHPVETQVRGVTNPVGDAHPAHFRPQRLVPSDPRGTPLPARKPAHAALTPRTEIPPFAPRAPPPPPPPPPGTPQT